MTLFDDILAQFPPDVQATVRKIWEALGPNEKASFQSLLIGFPSDTNLVKLLVKLSTAQIRQAFGSKHRVVIVGPTNVGKSTLYNQWIQNKRDQAAVSLPCRALPRKINRLMRPCLPWLIHPVRTQWGVWATRKKTWPCRHPRRPIFWCWFSTPSRGLKRPSRNCSTSCLL